MPRPRKAENQNLPSGVYRSKGWYWFKAPGAKWVALGKEWDKAARTRWAELSAGNAEQQTVAHLLDEHLKYRRQLVTEKKLAARTYEDNLEYAVNLKLFFGTMRPQDVNGRHVKAYLEKRAWQPPPRKGDDGQIYTPDPRRAPVRANKEISLLSSAFQWAMGSPDFPLVTGNPCYGIERNPTHRSERAPELWEIEAAKKQATPMWSLILDLAYIGGKRGCEIRLLPKLQAVQRDGLHVQAAKGGPEVIIEWSDDLYDSVLRIMAWSDDIAGRRNTSSPYLILARSGGPYTAQGWKTMMFKIVRRAIADKDNPLLQPFSFHPIRARSATDEEELYGTSPQARLGHKDRSTTDIYMRGRRAKKVKPLPLRRAS